MTIACESGGDSNHRVEPPCANRKTYVKLLRGGREREKRDRERHTYTVHTSLIFLSLGDEQEDITRNSRLEQERRSRMRTANHRSMRAVRFQMRKSPKKTKKNNGGHFPTFLLYSRTRRRRERRPTNGQWRAANRILTSDRWRCRVRGFYKFYLCQKKIQKRSQLHAFSFAVLAVAVCADRRETSVS